jgi:hypothetical protein
MSQEIIQLENSFERWGYAWSVIERTKEWALICQSISPETCNYNVCKIKQGKERVFPNGTTYPPKEELPSAEQWGRLAWNYGPDEEKAKAKYLELTK